MRTSGGASLSSLDRDRSGAVDGFGFAGSTSFGGGSGDSHGGGGTHGSGTASSGSGLAGGGGGSWPRSNGGDLRLAFDMLQKSTSCFVRDKATAFGLTLPAAWGPVGWLVMLCSFLRRVRP